MWNFVNLPPPDGGSPRAPKPQPSMEAPEAVGDEHPLMADTSSSRSAPTAVIRCSLG